MCASDSILAVLSSHSCIGRLIIVGTNLWYFMAKLSSVPIALSSRCVISDFVEKVWKGGR